MKNLIVSALLLFLFNSGFAQLPGGSIAPDFTVTDINGNAHHLSNYLNAGKSVILEFSSIACGYDWKYDQTEAMQDFYNAYGPSGSNEVMVLYINDSNWDTLQELNGIANPPTFGNWTLGKPFPMVLDPNVPTQYNINYTPAIFKICPNGIINGIGQPSAANLYSQVNYSCGSLQGVQNYARMVNTKNGFCGTAGNFETTIKNYGSNPIATAIVKLKENGNVVSTKNFSLSLAQFATATLAFDPVVIHPTSTYTAEIVSINGHPNHNSAFSTAALPFAFSKPTGINLQVKIHTDTCPNFMSWKITNSAGTIVASAGPYVGAGGSCGGPNANTIIQHNIALPTASDCYTLTLMDSNGLGWRNYEAYSPEFGPGIEVFSGSNLVYSNLTVGNFGSSLTIENFLDTNSLATTSFENSAIKIFPNPSTGKFNITSDDDISISVFDMMGKMIYKNETFLSNVELDLSKYANGMYAVAMTNTLGQIKYDKVIVNH